MQVPYQYIMQTNMIDRKMSKELCISIIVLCRDSKSERQPALSKQTSKLQELLCLVDLAQLWQQSQKYQLHIQRNLKRISCTGILITDTFWHFHIDYILLIPSLKFVFYFNLNFIKLPFEQFSHTHSNV